jgi:hypothetical protein
MTKNTDQYDVFLSYRRKGGVETALLLYYRLTRLRYNVSFDLETLRSGKFDEQLYTRIEQCKDVVVLMNKDALEIRENPEDDWLRLEVAHALKHQKNIIPVFLRDFDQSDKDTLPKDDVLTIVCKYEGVTASYEHFDSTFAKLCRLLISKPSLPLKGYIKIGKEIMGGASKLLELAKRRHLLSWPYTEKQKQLFNEVIKLTGCWGYQAQTLLHANQNLCEAAEKSAKTYPYRDTAFLDEYNVFLYTWNSLKTQIEHNKPSEEFLSKLESSPIQRAELNVTYELLRDTYEQAKNDAEKLKYFMQEDTLISPETRFGYISQYQKSIDLDAKSFSLWQMNLFRNINPSVLEDYKKQTVTHWTMLPELSGTWDREEKILDQKLDALLNAHEELLAETAKEVGNLRPELVAAERTLKDKLLKNGASPEQADHIVNMQGELAALKGILKSQEQHLEETRERVRQKFAPLESDDCGMLWGKSLRFLTVNMPDEALKCIYALRRKKDPQFSMAVCKAAEAFICQRDKLPFKSGVLVCFFEPPATSHAVLQLGDIVTHINDKPCPDCDACAATSNEKNRKMLIWRLDENGKFVSHEAIIPENQPRVALMNISE